MFPTVEWASLHQWINNQDIPHGHIHGPTRFLSQVTLGCVRVTIKIKANEDRKPAGRQVWRRDQSLEGFFHSMARGRAWGQPETKRCRTRMCALASRQRLPGWRPWNCPPASLHGEQKLQHPSFQGHFNINKELNFYAKLWTPSSSTAYHSQTPMDWWPSPSYHSKL